MQDIKKANMKITIDTKEDSHEELRKVIKMLSSLVGEEVMTNQGDIFGGSSETPTSEQGKSSDIFNVFNNTTSETKTEPEKTTEDKKEEKDDDLGIDIPGVEEYD